MEAGLGFSIVFRAWASGIAICLKQLVWDRLKRLDRLAKGTSLMAQAASMPAHRFATTKTSYVWRYLNTVIPFYSRVEET